MNYSSNFSRIIYFRSPYYFREMMSGIYGLIQRRKRYGKEYEAHLSFLQESQFWSEDRVTGFRNSQTTGFINQAMRTTPYYQENPAYHPIKTISDLMDFPVLSKEETRQQQVRLRSNELASMHVTWGKTSGTTGTPLRFPVTLDCFQREYAFRGLHYNWGNITLHDRQPFAFCAGHPVVFPERRKPPFWIYDHANNWLLLSSYHMTEENLVHYIRELDRFKPFMLGGYPSSIYLLALAYRKHGTGAFRPKVVYTSSETLYDHQRAVIESTFAAKLLNWYGNTEMVANIVECDQGELHLKHEHSFNEILDIHDQPCRAGETGRLVCTGFGNHAFPLIRYDIGDAVTIAADQRSKCGRNGLLIERVEGRTEDYILTPDGRFIGRLDHLFKAAKNLREAQVVQEEPGEVKLRIVRLSGYSGKDEQAIRTEAIARMGSAIRIRFEYVDSIERTANGKFRFIVSTLDQKKALESLI